MQAPIAAFAERISAASVVWHDRNSSFAAERSAQFGPAAEPIVGEARRMARRSSGRLPASCNSAPGSGTGIDGFLNVCLGQMKFMSDLFDLDNLVRHLRIYVESNDQLKPETGSLLEAALIHGEFERSDAARIAGLPERAAHCVLNYTITDGLLASQTPGGPLSMRIPTQAWETLFPGLYIEVR